MCLSPQTKRVRRNDPVESDLLQNQHAIGRPRLQEKPPILRTFAESEALFAIMAHNASGIMTSLAIVYSSTSS
jgi:hypothetical protein